MSEMQRVRVNRATFRGAWGEPPEWLPLEQDYFCVDLSYESNLLCDVMNVDPNENLQPMRVMYKRLSLTESAHGVWVGIFDYEWPW